MTDHNQEKKPKPYMRLPQLNKTNNRLLRERGQLTPARREYIAACQRRVW